MDGEEGASFRADLRTLEIQPGSRWVVAYQELDAGWPVATRLTLSLRGGRPPHRPSETEISIFHQGFEHLPLSDCLTIWERYRRFWRGALERLADSAHSRSRRAPSRSSKRNS